MLEVERLRRGPWGLYVFPPSSVLPAFSQWVHDQAAPWAARLVDVVREGRRSGVMRDGGGAYPDQARRVLDAARAVAELSRACDLPVPAFAPWALPLRRADTGPDPWLNLYGAPPDATAREALEIDGDPRHLTWRTAPGTYRVEAAQLLARASSDVGAASNTVTDFHHRVWITEDGRIVDRTAQAVPPPTGPDGEALTPDMTGVACPPGTAPAPAAPGDAVIVEAPAAWLVDTAWRCVGWSVWTPGALRASRDVRASVILPLAWSWRLCEAAADSVERLGSIGAVVTASREYVAAMNLAAALAGGVRVPSDLVAQAAREQLARYEPSDVDRALQSAGEAAMQSGNAYAAALGAIVYGFGSLRETVGGALQYAVDPWGRREPFIQSPYLSGDIQGSNYVAPTLAIPAAPPAPPFGLGRTTVEGLRAQRDAARRRATLTPRAREQLAQPDAPAASSGGGEVLTLGGLALVARLLGWW